MRQTLFIRVQLMNIDVISPSNCLKTLQTIKNMNYFIEIVHVFIFFYDKKMK